MRMTAAAPASLEDARARTKEMMRLRIARIQLRETMGITPLQAELLACIQAFFDQHGYCPSYDALRAALGLKAKSNIYRLIGELEERGYIRHLPNRSRSIEIVPRTPPACPHCGGALQ